MLHLATLMTYGQLENLWKNAGGNPRLASTMAAVAIAESHPMGDTRHARMGLLNYDRHELGGSFCGWQINLVHTTARGGPFDVDRLAHDPNYCAKAAVYVQHRQGLNAWTTYRYGMHLAYLQKPAPYRLPHPQRYTAFVVPRNRPVEGPQIGLAWLSSLVLVKALFRALGAKGEAVAPSRGARPLRRRVSA